MLAGAPMGRAPGLPAHMEILAPGSLHGATAATGELRVSPELFLSLRPQSRSTTAPSSAELPIIIMGLRNNLEALRWGKYAGNKGIIEKK